MRSKPSIRSFADRIRQREAGMSLLELLIASTIGLGLTALVSVNFISLKRSVRYDVQRTELLQNLRSALDIITINAKLTGENLPAVFPALEVVDNGSNPDELVFRRNRRDEILKVCDTLLKNSNAPLTFGRAGTTPGCVYTDQVRNGTVWTEYLSEQQGTGLAYLYDPVKQSGQFFRFDAVVDSGSEWYLTLASGERWAERYNVGQAAAYILEEWRFSLSGDVLQLVENGNTGSPARIAFGLTDLQVRVELLNGTSVDNFEPPLRWEDVRYIEIALAGATFASGERLERTLRSRIFPRNVLSN